LKNPKVKVAATLGFWQLLGGCSCGGFTMGDSLDSLLGLLSQGSGDGSPNLAMHTA
jgi:hypothetical protein